MKKFVCFALSLFFVVSGFALCGGIGAAEASVKLVYAEVNPAESLMGKTAQAFKEKVEELTKGDVVIDIQFSGVLGAENDVLDTMIGGAGTVDMSRVATYSLNSYGSKSMSLLSVPYIFSGREHFWKVARSDLGAKLLNESSELGLGVKGLFYAEEGFRHFFFNSKVEGLSDLAGKKIRVSNDPIMTGMVNGLKASPTVVSFTELYSALSSKVVDGAEQPIVNYQSNSFFEVAPFMILDGHTLGCAEVLITESAWGKLTDEQKAAIVEAGKYASEFNAELSAKIEEDCKAELKSKGVTFVEVTDLKAWQDACADVISQFSKGMEADYKAILDMAQ
ncbi:MAG: TRAP transporter substrate-binding protein [Synergistaceae bacterium]|jgi:tripartite ATP-independent transporter DctP family solute receptor|nr:TRAP transporter substrate-binding protein [Synergistaceae bacterium]